MLEYENRELNRYSDIMRKASVFFRLGRGLSRNGVLMTLIVARRGLLLIRVDLHTVVVYPVDVL